MRLISVHDLCPACTTNMDAVALDAAVRDALRNGDSVKLDFHGITGMTTSFLNSSFGTWVEVFGADALKGRVTITNYTPYLAAFIKRYLDDCIKSHNQGTVI